MVGANPQPEMPVATGCKTTLTIVMALENNLYPQDPRVRKEAEELATDGHDVIVLAPRGAGQTKQATVNGVSVKRYGLPRTGGAAGIAIEYLVALVQLTRHLISELLRGADVVHLHNPPDLFFPVGGFARALGRTVIFDHHDLTPELFEQKFGGGGRRASILRWCERMTMRVASVVISANESHRLIAIQRGRVDPERVVVVRNAPPAATLADEAVTRKGALTSPRLCYVGSLNCQDGVRVLPEILRRLCDAGLNPTLSLVGDGPEVSTIKRLAEEQAVLERIEFTGWVSHEQVPRIIEQADICLDVAPCTSLNHRSTMIKIGEYMAAARPIVTFDLQESRCTAGDCALYVACDDIEGYCASIVRLCADEQLRATMSAGALERVGDMTWEHSAEYLRRAYAIACGPTSAEAAMVAAVGV